MSDITVISATDAKHQHKLQACLPTWRNCAALADARFIVFAVDGAKVNIKGADVIPWHGAHGEHPRERALSAFIFGCAEHVDTEYHMKCDSVAVADLGATLPDYRGWDLVGNKCGNTKFGSYIPIIDHWLSGLHAAGKVSTPPLPSASARDAIQNEIRKLDKQRKKHKRGTPERQRLWDAQQRKQMEIDPYEVYWNSPEKKAKDTRWYVDAEYFMEPGEWPVQRMRHRRIKSWTKIMRTQVVRDMAGNMPLGRMVVPSEDTLCWRYCERLGLKWKIDNFGPHKWSHGKRDWEKRAKEAVNVQ